MRRDKKRPPVCSWFDYQRNQTLQFTPAGFHFTTRSSGPMTIVVSSPRLHFPFACSFIRIQRLDITPMQAHGIFHTIELNTNGILTRPLSTGTPQDRSSFRWRPLYPAFAQLTETYRITWLVNIHLAFDFGRCYLPSCHAQFSAVRAITMVDHWQSNERCRHSPSGYSGGVVPVQVSTSGSEIDLEKASGAGSSMPTFLESP